MSDSGPESFSPDEGGGSASEQLSEEARQRFAAAQAALQQIQREEKKAKKRDDGIAQIILQFLTDSQRTHLATLISRLVSLNCPSTFLLAILSLINEQCRAAVAEYLRENRIDPESTLPDHAVIPENGALTEAANEDIARWIVRVEQVMRLDEDRILAALLIDDHNIDGTILQLTSFVLQDFLVLQKRNVSFEQLQTLSAGILQALFRPAMQRRDERHLAEESATSHEEDA